MMAPRLLGAHGMLADSGFLVVCIDQHEVHHLRLLLDEIFGPEQFVADIVWQNAYTANATARWLSSTHDHLLVYARHAPAATVGRLRRTEAQRAAYRNPDDDPRGPWKAENLSASRPYSKGRFTIVTPSGRRVRPPSGRSWRCSDSQYAAWLADGRIWFGRAGTGKPMLKKYLKEVPDALTPSTWWPSSECGSNKEASTELKAMFDGEVVFDTPKPVRLLRRVVDLFCPTDGLVVDLFAGSGSTGHAVLEANVSDHGTRRFLGVQHGTPTSDARWPTLAAMCRERLRRAAASLQLDGPILRDFRLGPEAVPPWDRRPDDDVEGLRTRLLCDPRCTAPTEEAWATEQLLAMGAMLSTRVRRTPQDGWFDPVAEVLAARRAPTPQTLARLTPRILTVPDSAWPEPAARLAAVHQLRQRGCEVRFCAP